MNISICPNPREFIDVKHEFTATLGNKNLFPKGLVAKFYISSWHVKILYFTMISVICTVATSLLEE